jgi:hypothetical protein
MLAVGGVKGIVYIKVYQGFQDGNKAGPFVQFVGPHAGLVANENLVYQVTYIV